MNQDDRVSMLHWISVRWPIGTCKKQHNWKWILLWTSIVRHVCEILLGSCGKLNRKDEQELGGRGGG